MYKYKLLALFIVTLSALSHGAFVKAETKTLLQQGIEHYESGHFNRAITLWREVTFSLEETYESTVITEAYLGIAAAYQAIGLYQQGIEALDQALPLIQKIQDRALNSQWFSQLGNLYLAAGRNDEAIEKLQRAVTEARALKDAVLLANALNNLANALWVAEFETDAMTLYGESYALSRDHEAWDLAVQTQINILQIHIARGDFAEARVQLDEIAIKLQNLVNNYAKASHLSALTTLALKIQHHLPAKTLLIQAYQWSQQAITIAKELQNHRLLSFALGYQGQLYEQQSRFDEAKQLTQEALFFAQQEQADDILYLWQWQWARIARARGETPAAIKLYRDAIITLTPIRQELSYGYRHSSQFFQDSIRPVYSELVDLLLQQARKTRSKQERESLLLEARDITEILKTAELEDYFRDECVVETQSKSRLLNNIDNNSVVLYPIILPNRLELLISSSNKIEHRTIAISEQVLSETAYQLRALTQDPNNRRYRSYSQRLYKWLIKPIESILVTDNVDTIIMVPDGALRTIPLAALYDGSNFLIEKYAVGITPSLTLTAPQKLISSDLKILLSGVSQSVQGFPPLPYVPQELQDIQNNLGGTLLLDTNNTIKNLTRSLHQTEYSIIHMATHAQFGKTPEQSFLLTHDSKLTTNQLENLLQVGQFRDQAVELLTMSACETALGDNRAALGLAGIAIKASARSALASLWLVNDLATSKLMTEFYRQLAQDQSISKAKALQNAQKSFIQQSQHPANWAAFILIGNWL